jgi:site-specific recombinase XerD
MIDNFISAMEYEGKSKHTIRMYRKVLNDFSKQFEINDLDSIKKITKKDIAAYRNSLFDGENISATVNAKMRVISAFFNWLLQNDYVAFNPTVGVKKVKEPMKEPEYFTDEEIDCLYDACKSIDDRVLISLLLTTGIRRDEARKIKVTDIKDNHLLVHGKGNRERTIPLHESMVGFLNEYMVGHNSEYLFCSKEGKQITPESIRNRAKAIIMMSKISEKRKLLLSTHSFRHTVGTRLTENNAPTKTVQIILGHSRITTTERYAHVSDKAKTDAINSLNVRLR